MRVKIRNNQDYNVTTTVQLDQRINEDRRERLEENSMRMMNADETLGEEETETRKLLDRHNRNIDNTGHALVSMKQMRIVLSRNNMLFKYPSRNEVCKELKINYDSKECNEAQVKAFIDKEEIKE